MVAFERVETTPRRPSPGCIRRRASRGWASSRRPPGPWGRGSTRAHRRGVHDRSHARLGRRVEPGCCLRRSTARSDRIVGGLEQPGQVDECVGVAQVRNQVVLGDVLARHVVLRPCQVGIRRARPSTELMSGSAARDSITLVPTLPVAPVMTMCMAQGSSGRSGQTWRRWSRERPRPARSSLIGGHIAVQAADGGMQVCPGRSAATHCRWTRVRADRDKRRRRAGNPASARRSGLHRGDTAGGDRDGNRPRRGASALAGPLPGDTADAAIIRTIRRQTGGGCSKTVVADRGFASTAVLLTRGGGIHAESCGSPPPRLLPLLADPTRRPVGAGERMSHRYDTSPRGDLRHRRSA